MRGYKTKEEMMRNASAESNSTQKVQKRSPRKHYKVIMFFMIVLILGVVAIISYNHKTFEHPSDYEYTDSDKIVIDSKNEDSICTDSLIVDDDGIYMIDYVAFRLLSDSSLVAHIEINTPEECLGKKRISVYMRFWQSNYQSHIADEEGMQLYVENDINFSGSAIDGTLRISKKILDRIRANCYGDYTIFDVCIYDYNTRDAIYPYIGKLYHSKEKYGKSDVLRKTQIHQER